MMNWLQGLVKIAERQLYYHGTSALNLPTILSQGLNFEHEPVYDGSFRDRDHSIETMGGIYLTNNLMTAVQGGSSSNQKLVDVAYNKADHGFVIVQIEKNSPHILADEDSVMSPNYAIQDMFPGLSPNGYWFAAWVHNGFEALDPMAEKYVEMICSSFKIHDIDPRFVQNLIPHAKEVIMAYANREIAITVEKEDTWDSLKREYPEFVGHKISDWNVKFQQALDLLLHKAHRITSGESQAFQDNVRSMEPISFRGANRIVAVIQAHDRPNYFAEIKKRTGEPRGYYNEIEVLYLADDGGPAIEMFIRDWKQRVGKHFIVKKGDEVFYEDFNQELR